MQEGKSINIVVAALGGEGGSVFANWVIDVAQASGWQAQSTQLAGVAQRTGATIYYIELFPPDAAGVPAVMSLFPAQGDLDIVITTEIAEAGRMLTRGFVSPQRTTLITSSHRVYGITEKIALSDGTVDDAAIIEIAAQYARRLLCFDMAEIAQRHGAVISAPLLGALAGSGALPFAEDSYQQAIRGSGMAVQTNLAAFAASLAAARAGGVSRFEPGLVKPPQAAEEGFSLPAAATAQGQLVLDRIAGLPGPVHELSYHAVKKLADYQDVEYAGAYLDRLESVVAADDGRDQYLLSRTMARFVALWMAYEDVPRVAQLKIRADRQQAIRQEVGAQDGQIIGVTEFFSPRVEEIAAMLPVALGRLLLTPVMARAMGWFMGGRKLRTDTVMVFALLRMLAGLRRLRRRSLGYQLEMAQLNAWYDKVISAASRDMNAAIELAECGRLVKGYGDTRQRLLGLLAELIGKVDGDTPAARIAAWRDQALASDTPGAIAS